MPFLDNLLDMSSKLGVKTSDIVICTLSPEEFKDLLNELIEIYQNGYKGLEKYAYQKRHDIKSYLKWLYKTDSESFLVAFENGRPIGFVAGCRFWHDKLYGEIGEIHELVVDKSLQGKGIGKKLVQEIITAFKKNHDKIGLWVGEHNEQAIAFYKKMGFKVVGQVGKWLRMIKET